LDHCSLRKFLRKHTIDDYVGGIVRKRGFGPQLPCSGVSSPSTEDPPSHVMEDRVAELDREFDEFMAKFPAGQNDTAGYASRRPEF